MQIKFADKFLKKILKSFLTFLLQAILFYVPRWLWKNWEAGKVSALRMDLNLGIISEVEKKLKKKLLIDYMYSNLKHHNFWAYRYFFCEFLSLINVGGKKNLIIQVVFQSKQTMLYKTKLSIPVIFCRKFEVDKLGRLLRKQTMQQYCKTVHSSYMQSMQII